jgi:hypothetical protein
MAGTDSERLRRRLRAGDAVHGVGHGENLSGAEHCGWLANICSIKVVPERGMPTTKTGSREGRLGPLCRA